MAIARSILLTGALGILLKGGAVAQQSPQEQRAAARVRAQKELDRLRPLLADAQARWSVANAQHLQRERSTVVFGTDTIQVGPLRVMVLDGQGEEARPYFESAWARYGRMLDGQVPAELSQPLFAFEYGLSLRDLEMPPSVARVKLVWGRPAEVQLAVDNAVGRVLSGILPQAQRGWAGPTVGYAPDFASIHRELILGAKPPYLTDIPLPSHAFSTSQPLADCRGGDLDACWVAMGVTGNVGEIRHMRFEGNGVTSQDIVLLEEEWRRIAAQDIALWHGDNLTRWLDQLARGWGSTAKDADETLLRHRDKLTPLGGLSRYSLVSVALEMGGRGALTHLIDFRGSPRGYELLTEGPIDYRRMIAQTAGVNGNQVMAEWLRRVQAARPDRAGADREARLGSFLWIALFIALATRSTRWRLG